jgi:hypothetical protein
VRSVLAVTTSPPTVGRDHGGAALLGEHAKGDLSAADISCRNLPIDRYQFIADEETNDGG